MEGTLSRDDVEVRRLIDKEKKGWPDIAGLIRKRTHTHFAPLIRAVLSARHDRHLYRNHNFFT